MKIDNNIVIVFNGEIYNYLELKKKLEPKYKFKTNSDTEVLGYMYKEYGKDMLNQLEGMFAFAIYDEKKDEIFIARDFVGQKPLVYFQDDSGFYFASEIPVLLNYLKDKEIDLNSLGIYLTSNFHHIPAPFTIFKKIKKLEPSHYLLIKKGKIIEKK
jgi:asparagine synthase (glutamine-hydrolysing)